MEYNAETEQFKFSIKDQYALGLDPEITDLPKSEADNLLWIAEERRIENAGRDISEFIGPARNEIILDKESTAKALNDIIKGLAPYLSSPGEAAEMYLQGYIDGPDPDSD